MLNILNTNLDKFQKSANNISVAKACISIPTQDGKKMGLQPNDFLLIAQNPENKVFYIAKKPVGFSGGHSITQPKANHKFLCNLSIEKYKIPRGYYNLGNMHVHNITKDGEIIFSIKFYELQPL